MKYTRKSYTKIAFTLSVCLLVMWAFFGTGTTIAWFTDTTPVEKNTFLIGELNMVVSHKLADGTYEEIESDTKVFDDEALYEPGYIQVVYLKVENKGNVPFEYKFSVDVNDVTTATSVLGNEIFLPNYLKFGVIFGASEAQLDRAVAKAMATGDFPEYTGDYPLNTYSQKDDSVVGLGGERYIAVIVRMPEEITNVANYRGNDVPTVKLGLNVMASQEGTLQ